MSKAHNNDLSPIGIKDHSGQDSLMSIDDHSTHDDYLAIFLFPSIILTSFISGYFGPPQKTFDSSYYILTDTSKQIRQQISSILPSNQFLTISIRFDNLSPLDVDFSYLISYQKSHETVSQKNFHIQMTVSNQKILLSHTNLINFDSALVFIEFHSKHDKITSSLEWSSQEISHTYFQVWIRGIFFFSSLTTTILFILRLKRSTSELLFEQQITLVLMILAVLSSDPSYWVHIFGFSPFLNFYSIISNNLFQACIYFSFLSLFYPKNLLKNIFCISIFFIQFFDDFFLVHECADYFSSDNNLIISILRYLSFGYVALFGFFLSFKFFSLSRDSPEYQTFIDYFIVSLIFFSVEVLKLLISYTFTRINITSSFFSLSLSVGQALVIIFAYFHWPYDVKIDQPYKEPNFSDTGGIFDANDLIPEINEHSNDF